MSIEPDFTLIEAKAALDALLNEIGPDADAFACLNTRSKYGRNGPALHVSISPDGVMGAMRLTAVGASWRELIENATAAWAERSEAHTAATIRKMALKIIEVTADLGECTDRALRADFTAKDVTAYAEAAAQQANDLASGGPFDVLLTTGANDQVAA